MAAASMLYGGRFEPDNRNNPRTVIAGWVPPGAWVLEVGPGDGVIGAWLVTTKHCRAVAVEVAAAAEERLREVFDHVVIGSIESLDVAQQAAALGPYDAVIFADVLEHLVDPWQVLRQTRPMLATGGHVLLSVPNIAHWSARLNLLRGRFDYTNGYLMDRTHLRWFTQRSARAMAREAGYRVEAAATVFKPHFARFWPALNGYQIVLKLAPRA
jgi:2-polyprenyl-3-methyl-5-hydroxy-6-metoxy-1,4-benzoquinol methylase